MSVGALLIREERDRQQDRLGYTIEHDRVHIHDEFVEAAKCYLTDPEDREVGDPAGTPTTWPWSPVTWKPSPDDRIRELTKAGALIAAEIDRLTVAQAEQETLAAAAS